LEPPFDIREALDEIGDDVLAGTSPRAALNRLLHRGSDGRDGLDTLRRQARQRVRELRRGGQLDGTLQQVRELLEAAVEEERQALFPDPDDAARLAEGLSWHDDRIVVSARPGTDPVIDAGLEIDGLIKTMSVAAALGLLVRDRDRPFRRPVQQALRRGAALDVRVRPPEATAEVRSRTHAL
jgi:hypothetical protein